MWWMEEEKRDGRGSEMAVVGEEDGEQVGIWEMAKRLDLL